MGKISITNKEIKKLRESSYYEKMFKSLDDKEIKKIVKKWLKNIDKLNQDRIDWNLKKVLSS